MRTEDLALLEFHDHRNRLELYDLLPRRRTTLHMRRKNQGTGIGTMMCGRCGIGWGHSECAGFGEEVGEAEFLHFRVVGNGTIGLRTYSDGVFSRLVLSRFLPDD